MVLVHFCRNCILSRWRPNIYTNTWFGADRGHEVIAYNGTGKITGIYRWKFPCAFLNFWMLYAKWKCLNALYKISLQCAHVGLIDPLPKPVTTQYTDDIFIQIHLEYICISQMRNANVFWMYFERIWHHNTSTENNLFIEAWRHVFISVHCKSLVQVMVCHLFGTKPFLETAVINFSFKTLWNHFKEFWHQSLCSWSLY